MTFLGHKEFLEYINLRPFLIDSCSYLTKMQEYSHLSEKACCSGKRARYGRQLVDSYLNIENMPPDEQNRLKESAGEEVVFLVDGREFYKII